MANDGTHGSVGSGQVPADAARSTRRAELPFTESHTLRSDFYPIEHHLAVYLPPGYDESTERSYPVLYLPDSHVLFGAASNALSLYSGERQVEEIILVGIAEAWTWPEMLRTRSYLYTPDPHPVVPHGGGAAAFARFLAEQLFPFVEGHYRVRADDRGLVGFSLGGLWAAYALAAHPGLFRRYLVISPPVDYAHARIYAALDQLRGQPLDCTIYAATSEHDYRDVLAAWPTWAGALTSGDYPGLRFHHEVFPGENHDSAALPALLKGLKHLYGRERSPSPH